VCTTWTADLWSASCKKHLTWIQTTSTKPTGGRRSKPCNRFPENVLFNTNLSLKILCVLRFSVNSVITFIGNGNPLIGVQPPQTFLNFSLSQDFFSALNCLPHSLQHLNIIGVSSHYRFNPRTERPTNQIQISNRV
jgi:hypothetical protein